MANNDPRLWLVHDLLLRAAGKAPEKPCLIHRGQILSYSEVLALAQKLAAMLIEKGLNPGDRVGVYFEKSIDETVSILAVSMAGGIFIDINPLQKTRQVLHILKNSGARFFITSHTRFNVLSSDLNDAADLEVIILNGKNPEAESNSKAKFIIYDWKQLHAYDVNKANCHRRTDADPAAIIYTSGSTGLPKGVVLSHRNIVEGAKTVSSYVNNTGEDRILSALPFSFDYGMNQLTTSLYVGGTLVLLNYLTPQDIINAITKERITGFAGIPTIWTQLLQYKWSKEDFASLRYITNTGGRFPKQQVMEYRRRLPGAKIYLMYGLTEAFRSTFLEPEQVDNRPTSIGKAIPNAEILIINDQGQRCKPGEVGELVHRGALVAMGYWNDPEKTNERYRPNPLQPPELQISERVVYSGDYVKQDEEGYIYFVGRKDDMIKSSGFRVSPTEIEEVFYSTGFVQDAVALGIPDEAKGESIKTIVTLRKEANITTDELMRKIAKDLPSYSIPKKIEIRDTLPRNPNGKIDRAAIKKQELKKHIW